MEPMCAIEREDKEKKTAIQRTEEFIKFTSFFWWVENNFIVEF